MLFYVQAYPLDMSQYSNLFNSTRIPEIGKDRLVRNEKANHILIMRGGHFYTFDVINKEGWKTRKHFSLSKKKKIWLKLCLCYFPGEMLEPREIYACLDYIQKDAVAPAQHPLGYLTSENRDRWAATRQLLLQDNREQVEAIDSALFNLVLDDAIPGDNREEITKTFLYGNGGNRCVILVTNLSYEIYQTNEEHQHDNKLFTDVIESCSS